MRQKTLILLSVATLILLLAAIFMPSTGTTRTPPATGAGPVFPTLKDWVGTAARIVIKGADGTVTLDRGSAAPGAGEPQAAWTVAEKSGYPASAASVQQLVNSLQTLRYVEPKTRRPDLFPRLEVEEAGKPEAKSRQVEVFDGNGARIAGVIIGKAHYGGALGGDDGVYIRLPEDAQSWLAQPPVTVSSDVLGWIDRRVTDIDPGRVQSVALTGPDGKTLTIGRATATDMLSVRELPPNTKLKSGDPVVAIGAAFRGVELTDVRPATQLGTTGASSAQLVTLDGLTVNLALVDQDGGTWAIVTASGTGDAAKEAADLAAATKGWAYKLPTGKASVLKTRLAELIEAPAKPS
ncbi:MAG TPA: DUF4340 domain-containing protein [Stellaceae bacterium]|nr:DUF4340 domain-containing protein [Stellaceae bacterium]